MLESLDMIVSTSAFPFFLRDYTPRAIFFHKFNLSEADMIYYWSTDYFIENFIISAIAGALSHWCRSKQNAE